MNVLSLTVLVGLVCTAALASAQTTEVARQPRLAFRTIPMEGSTGTEHKVTPYRLYDKLIVTVWDPVACGQQPSDATVSIKGNKVYLSYKLSSAQVGAKSCTLMSEFDVSDVPNRDLEVHFAGGAEPYTVATMRKCPHYKPTTPDIWECLVPAKE
jgi:hypothetical protein